MKVKNPIIVNGLQTTRIIYDIYQTNQLLLDNVYVLVRLYETTDDELVRKITDATNTQSAIDYRDKISNSNFNKYTKEVFANAGIGYLTKRGETFDNCILIVDEFQNLNGHLLSTVITRIGEDCKIFFAGDGDQTDLRNENDKKGLYDFMKIIDKMPSFVTVEFGIEDCVRSGIVKEFLIAQHELGITL